MIHRIPESIHAILSPSKAHQWLACIGSLAATRDLPRKPGSSYAAEGTVYHDVARRALTEDKDCSAYVGDQYEVESFKFTIDADNAEAAQCYVDQVRALPGKRFVEVDLEYSALLGVPKWYERFPDRLKGEPPAMVKGPVAAGTGDAVVLDYENGVIYCIDLKFGRGDTVYASYMEGDRRVPNPQIALYLAAAVERYELLGITDDWKAVGAISQPRINHYDSHTMTVGELRAWTTQQRQKAQGAYSLWCGGPDQPDLLAALTPGEKQCRWCPLSGNCAAQSAQVLARFPKADVAAATQSLVTLSNEALAEVLDIADHAEAFFSAARTEGVTRIWQGQVIPNWKAVTGRRGNRDLNTEANVEFPVDVLQEAGIEAEEPATLQVADIVAIALGDAAYKPRELQTAAKLQNPLEKRAPLLWAALQEHVTQSEGKPGIARMEDPRPPVAVVSVEFPTIEPGKESLL